MLLLRYLLPLGLGSRCGSRFVAFHERVSLCKIHYMFSPHRQFPGDCNLIPYDRVVFIETLIRAQRQAKYQTDCDSISCHFVFFSNLGTTPNSYFDFPSIWWCRLLHRHTGPGVIFPSVCEFPAQSIRVRTGDARISTRDHTTVQQETPTSPGRRDRDGGQGRSDIEICENISLDQCPCWHEHLDSMQSHGSFKLGILPENEKKKQKQKEWKGVSSFAPLKPEITIVFRSSGFEMITVMRLWAWSYGKRHLLLARRFFTGPANGCSII